MGSGGVGWRTRETRCTPDAFDGAGDGIGITAVDHHPGTEDGEKFRHGEPDAAGATDDDGTAARQCASDQLWPSWPNCMTSMFQ